MNTILISLFVIAYFVCPISSSYSDFIEKCNNSNDLSDQNNYLPCQLTKLFDQNVDCEKIIEYGDEIWKDELKDYCCLNNSKNIVRQLEGRVKLITNYVLLYKHKIDVCTVLRSMWKTLKKVYIYYDKGTFDENGSTDSPRAFYLTKELSKCISQEFLINSFNNFARKFYFMNYTNEETVKKLVKIITEQISLIDGDKIPLPYDVLARGGKIGGLNEPFFLFLPGCSYQPDAITTHPEAFETPYSLKEYMLTFIKESEQKVKECKGCISHLIGDQYNSKDQQEIVTFYIEKVKNVISKIDEKTTSTEFLTHFFSVFVMNQDYPENYRTFFKDLHTKLGQGYKNVNHAQIEKFIRDDFKCKSLKTVSKNSENNQINEKRILQEAFRDLRQNRNSRNNLNKYNDLQSVRKMISESSTERNSAYPNFTDETTEFNIFDISNNKIPDIANQESSDLSDYQISNFSDQNSPDMFNAMVSNYTIPTNLNLAKVNISDSNLRLNLNNKIFFEDPNQLIDFIKTQKLLNSSQLGENDTIKFNDFLKKGNTIKTIEGLDLQFLDDSKNLDESIYNRLFFESANLIENCRQRPDKFLDEVFLDFCLNYTNCTDSLSNLSDSKILIDLYFNGCKSDKTTQFQEKITESFVSINSYNNKTDNLIDPNYVIKTKKKNIPPPISELVNSNMTYDRDLQDGIFFNTDGTLNDSENDKNHTYNNSSTKNTSSVSQEPAIMSNRDINFNDNVDLESINGLINTISNFKTSKNFFLLILILIFDYIFL